MSRPAVRFLDPVIGDRALIAQDIDQLIHDVLAAQTSTGTNRATAFAIANHITEFSSVPSGTGAVLPAMNVGEIVYIFNDDGANALQVYAPGTATIDGVAAATGVPLTHAKRCAYLQLTATAIISYQLGAVSA